MSKSSCAVQIQPGFQKHADLWFRRYPNREARARLFCFPYAGATAGIFRNWHDWCAPEIEAVAVEFPGRGRHIQGTSTHSMSEMVEGLLNAMEPLQDLPFAFFGHSMGALIAFELCRALPERGRRTPVHLFVSGMCAPHLYRVECPIHALPDEQFTDALRTLQGHISNTRPLGLALPSLRLDFRLIESYQYRVGKAFDHPITAFGGVRDSLASRAELEAWQVHTGSTCTVCLLPGDHFFMRNEGHLIVARIAESLAQSV